jgi:hypothetical protein
LLGSAVIVVYVAGSFNHAWLAICGEYVAVLSLTCAQSDKICLGTFLHAHFFRRLFCCLALWLCLLILSKFKSRAVVLFVDGYGSVRDDDVDLLFLKFDLLAPFCGSLFKLALKEVLLIFEQFFLGVLLLELKLELVLGILVQDNIFGGEVQSDNGFWFCFNESKTRSPILHLFGGRNPVHFLVTFGLKS